jgi:diguanylate cyclase (GGDEF)-like protein
MASMESKATLLVIDDTVQNIETLAEAVEDIFTIIFATRAAEGLDLAVRENPDLILLDVVMPDLDGYQVCGRLKSDHRTVNIPVVFVTALGTEEDQTRGFELGAVDYITKPFSTPVVRARLRNHLELKRYRDFLADLAYKDGLTGIPNRRHFESFLDREWRRAARNGQPLSVLLMDVDHFKAFNDNHGHQAGDDCLRRVAQALNDTIHRPADLVARYGGEEFVCILGDTTLPGARQAAARIVATVAGLAIPHGFSPSSPFVSLSMGLATACPVPGLSPEGLIEIADRRLYLAKQGGRNRWVAEDQPAPSLS